MPCLESLPYEVLSYIVGEIDFDDVFNLGQTCKALKFLLTEERICKSILQSKLRYSLEAEDARDHRCSNVAALRRAAKRRDALTTAKPFTVAIVGLADTYLYCNGVLCYTLGQSLRVLDLHYSGETETAINIPKLVSAAIPSIGDNTRGQFQVLYCSHSIVSCLYKSFICKNPTAWLIAFNIKLGVMLVTKRLDSTSKLFVRHNNDFLYYGTHSEIDTDGYKNWVVRGYDFKNKIWFPQKLDLSDILGSEMDSTVCFELHQGYFYALSNQTSLEVEEIDWTSFYHCVRFPLASPERKDIERTKDINMWRRQHQEGPIDDRWTSLRLGTDDNSGELKIIECRREWQPGSSRSRRTCYTTDIDFRIQPEDDIFDKGHYASSSSPSVASITSTVSSPKLSIHDLSAFPDEPITRLLSPEDNPHHMQPRPRLPRYTHPENNNAGRSLFTLTDSPVRYYHTSSSSFLDLVNDPCPNAPTTQRLRLRTTSRKVRPPSLHPALSCTTENTSQGSSSDLSTALNEAYIDQPTQWWPPAPDCIPSNEDVGAWYTLLNPPSHLGRVEGTADERSLVYATGGHGEPQALVFIGFDPAIRLAGLKRWTNTTENMRQNGVGEGPHIDGRACSTQHEDIVQAQGHNVDDADRPRNIKENGKGKAKPGTGGTEMSSPFEASGDVQGIMHSLCDSTGEICDWATQEKAMYQAIARGFYFGSDRSAKG